MPIDPYAALNAMLRAEAARFTVAPPTPSPAPLPADTRPVADAPVDATPGE
ncbi:hypothetical protein ACIQWR_33975 [Streptomyces sp. NPDC098789]|uniref:hypothetical protein n=1 Tax=Streptomyces sp. NPDC098789 TaxID=3366098 RepID=UPI003800C4FD